VKAQEFYEALLSDGLSVQSANNMVTGGLAYVSGRINALYGLPNFAAAVDKAKTGDIEPRHALIASQARGLLAAAGNGNGDLLAQRDYAACYLGLFTGMRAVSLVGISLERVVEGPEAVLLNVIVKGGRRADIPIAPWVWARLAGYREALDRETGPLLPRVTQVSIKTDVRAATSSMTTNGLYKALKRVADRVPLPKFYPHIFRHTFATWCRQAKIEDYLIEVVTAHKSNQGLVARVYTDREALHAEVASRCADAIEAKLFPSPAKEADRAAE
jgi:integrase